MTGETQVADGDLRKIIKEEIKEAWDTKSGNDEQEDGQVNFVGGRQCNARTRGFPGSRFREEAVSLMPL